LKSVEDEYMELFFRRIRLQWENYACGAQHDLNAMDGDIYRLVSTAASSGFSGRKEEIWRAIVTRTLVDSHPEVSLLRNRLDNLNSYSSDLPGGLPPDEVRLETARRMRPDVMKVIRLRNELAREFGYPSYLELALSCEELNLGSVRKTIEQYLANNLERARHIARKHGLTWERWFQDLSIMGRLPVAYRPEIMSRSLLRTLGLDDLLNRITFLIKDSGLAGYTEALSVPDDVRVLLKKDPSLHGMKTLYHELGHAVFHAANCERGLYATWNCTENEVMAVVLERIGLHVTLHSSLMRIAEDISVLENVRCSLSTLFEFHLWHSPEQAEELYLKYYARMGLPIADPVIWALDSFRSIDPVYIHSYVLGAMVAEKTLSYLHRHYGTCHAHWGRWLREHYYAPGRKVPLSEKVLPLFR